MACRNAFLIFVLLCVAYGCFPAHGQENKSLKRSDGGDSAASFVDPVYIGYMAAMTQKIEERWNNKKIYEQVKIQFRLSSQGTVSNIIVLNAPLEAKFQKRVRNCILRCSPFAKLPIEGGASVPQPNLDFQYSFTPGVGIRGVFCPK